MKLRFQLLCLLALMISAGDLCAQKEVEAALGKTQADLKAAMAKLEKTRESIAAEKPKISADFNAVEQQLSEKRRLLRIARMGEQDRQRELRILQRDLATRTQDANSRPSPAPADPRRSMTPRGGDSRTRTAGKGSTRCTST